jgi:hypothetical protein
MRAANNKFPQSTAPQRTQNKKANDERKRTGGIDALLKFYTPSISTAAGPQLLQVLRVST